MHSVLLYPILCYVGNFFLNYFKETEVSFSVPQTLFLGRQCYGKTILGENECVL